MTVSSELPADPANFIFEKKKKYKDVAMFLIYIDLMRAYAKCAPLACTPLRSFFE